MTWLPPLAVSAYLFGFVFTARFTYDDRPGTWDRTTKPQAIAYAIFWPLLAAAALGCGIIWSACVGLVTSVRFAGRHASAFLFSGLPEPQAVIPPSRPYTSPTSLRHSILQGISPLPAIRPGKCKCILGAGMLGACLNCGRKERRWS